MKLSDLEETSMSHPHADLMKQFAEDASYTNEPWKLWEWSGTKITWIECRLMPRWIPSLYYRRKRTAAETKPLPLNTFYWVPCLHSCLYYELFTWHAEIYDFEMLERGLVYLNKDAAILETKKLISIQKQKMRK
jgi:hypothetical protein